MFDYDGIGYGEPADLTTASGDDVQVIRIGSAIGLGVASGLGVPTGRWAAMATLYPAEARRIAAELIRAADEAP
jgi:hypothetical protein